MIPGVPSLGGMELLIILAIILLFFGAKRVPELARGLGRGKREFHKGIKEAEAEERDTATEAHDERGEEAPLKEEARSRDAREASTNKEAENSRAERSPH